MKRVAVAVLIAVALGAGLTGCARFEPRDPAIETPSATPSAPASVDTAGDVLADLDAADDAVAQAEGDGRAGEEAARTDDAP